MPDRHLATMLEGYALYRIPYGRTFVIKCQKCGAMKEIDRASLNKLPQMASPKEISPGFRCTLCGEKNARIMQEAGLKTPGKALSVFGRHEWDYCGANATNGVPQSVRRGCFRVLPLD